MTIFTIKEIGRTAHNDLHDRPRSTVLVLTLGIDME